MKKRLILALCFSIFIVMISTSKTFIVQAAQNPSNKTVTQQKTTNQLKFDNKVFRLKFSAYAPETKSYMNEYYRAKENGDNWTGLIGVQYLKRINSPLEAAKQLETLAYSQTKVRGNILYNKQENKAIVALILFGKNDDNSEYIEQNVYKIEKARNKKGVMLIHYAHKYPVQADTNRDELQATLKSNQTKWVNAISKLEIPKIVEKDIKAWK